EGVGDLTSAFEHVKALSAKESVGEIVDLWKAIGAANASASDTKTSDAKVLTGEIESALALSKGEASLRACFELTAAAKGENARRIASYLAFSRSANELLGALAEATNETFELAACWLHEAVLRGTAFDREAGAIAFLEQLKKKKHPLAELPLRLIAS